MNLLEEFLTEIADAIRKRKGKTDLIEAQQFAEEIESIPQDITGAFQEKSVDITSVSTITVTPDTGYNGLSKVNITPKIQSKSQTITSNGTTTITPDTGYAGLSSVAITTNVSNSNLKVLFGQAGDWIKNKQYTIPATAKYAIISVNWIKHHDTPDPTVSLTVSKGSITNMDGTTLAWGDKDGWGSPDSYNSSNIIYKNYKKRFTNTTGQASTLTCNITSSYGLLGGNIIIVY